MSLSSPDESRVVVLLVDDQAIIAAAVREMFTDEPDIQLHYCGDPTEAIDTALRVKPTVILQDLVMPEIDGMTLVRYYRAHQDTRDIPLIVLSSKEEPTIKAESFANGANDYLVKLPDKLELTARVRYHSRGYVALQQRNQAFEALARELADAARYVESLLPRPDLEGEHVRTCWAYLPSAQLGGDTFGYHWIDERNFAIYLLDVCGHGVGAALLAVSVMNVLRSQSLKNTDFLDPASVLAALNTAFPMENNNNMFFTIWYGVYDHADRKLTYSSGGHPPAVLVTGTERSAPAAARLTTSGFLVGGVPGAEYRNATVGVSSPATLLVYSDGIYEVTRASDGTMLALDDWLALLAREGGDANARLDDLLDRVREIQGREAFDDDVSLLRVDFRGRA